MAPGSFVRDWTSAQPLSLRKWGLWLSGSFILDTASPLGEVQSQLVIVSRADSESRRPNISVSSTRHRASATESSPKPGPEPQGQGQEKITYLTRFWSQREKGHRKWIRISCYFIMNSRKRKATYKIGTVQCLNE